MSFDALRAVGLGVQLAATLGAVDITATPPVGDPFTTAGFWIEPLAESRPIGQDFQRRDTRRVLVIPRTADVPEPVRGTLFLVTEDGATSERTWRADGYELVETDCWRVIVQPAD